MGLDYRRGINTCHHCSRNLYPAQITRYDETKHFATKSNFGNSQNAGPANTPAGVWLERGTPTRNKGVAAHNQRTPGQTTIAYASQPNHKHALLSHGEPAQHFGK
jgi:hypothetical protein